LKIKIRVEKSESTCGEATTKTTTMQPASVREKQCKWLATRVSCSLITYSHVQNISGKSRKLS